MSKLLYMIRLIFILFLLFFYENSYSQTLNNRDSSINYIKDSIKTSIRNKKSSLDSSIKKQSADRINQTNSNIDSINN